MSICKDQVVSIHYTLTDEKGTVLDTSQGKSPLKYIHGQGHIIPGLEEALEGQESGANIQVSIPPEKAYGPRDDNLLKSVPRNQFENAENIQVGMHFQVETEAGPMLLSVAEVHEDSVVVDGNHPLAGKTLNFTVEVVDTRSATPEELEHGHVHN